VAAERMNPRRTALFLVALALGLAAAGCGEKPQRPVAFVGETAVSREQLDASIEQLRADRRRKGEGEEFPERGSVGYRHLRDSVLGLLVFQAELRQAAERLGIRVRDDEVDRLIDAGGGAPGEEEGGSLGRAAREIARDSVRAQLLYQRIYEQVTSSVTAPTAAERSAQRRAAMARFIAHMKKTARVRYEPGYAPGS
jgi:SurA-like protein